MDVEVDRDAGAVDERRGEIAHQCDALRLGEIFWDGDFVVAGNTCVLPFLGRLGGIPERGAVLGPGRRPGRGLTHRWNIEAASEYWLGAPRLAFPTPNQRRR